MERERLLQSETKEYGVSGSGIIEETGNQHRRQNLRQLPGHLMIGWSPLAESPNYLK